jgi:peptide methionine sulfoxide reductase MsrB
MRNFSKDPAAISKLTPEQYRVTQQGATERPGTGEYLDNDEPGIYLDNLSPVPAGERFSVTGHILHEIHELPDEAKVKPHTVQ